MVGTTTRPEGYPGPGSYVAAVLIPIVGAILAIIALARDHVGPGLALAGTAALACSVWGTVFVLVALSHGASA
jgi:hypothetical protein